MSNEPLVAHKIVTLLMATSKNLLLYPAAHPQIIGAVEALWQEIFTYLRGNRRLVISIADGEIFLDRELLVDASLSGQEFVTACASKNINRIVFLPGVTQQEIIGFLTVLNMDFGSGQPDVAAELQKAGVTQIEIKRLLASGSQPEKPQARINKTHYHHYELAVASLGECYSRFQQDRQINIDQVGSIVSWIVGAVASKNPALLALAALRKHDEYICHHSINVAILAATLGTRLGLDQPQLTWLGLGAVLHDIGKIVIPQEIINKPGRLTSDEWQIMKSHPLESVKILSTLPDLAPAAMVVAFEHHLGDDLSGYPEVSAGYQPHFFSRIVRIADTYDGLTSARSYHSAHLPTQALTFLTSSAGDAFNPALVKLFVRSIGLFPVGSVVRLSDGRVAIVKGENDKDLLRPIVRILSYNQPEEEVELATRPELAILEPLSPDEAGIDIDSELAPA